MPSRATGRVVDVMSTPLRWGWVVATAAWLGFAVFAVFMGADDAEWWSFIGALVVPAAFITLDMARRDADFIEWLGGRVSFIFITLFLMPLVLLVYWPCRAWLRWSATSSRTESRLSID